MSVEVILLPPSWAGSPVYPCRLTSPCCCGDQVHRGLESRADEQCGVGGEPVVGQVAIRRHPAKRIVARLGDAQLRRTTMEDVARRSRVGRAALYQRFPAKTALIDAVVLAEARRYIERSARRVRTPRCSKIAWSAAPCSP